MPCVWAYSVADGKTARAIFGAMIVSGVEASRSPCQVWAWTTSQPTDSELMLGKQALAW
jgi:hypothetical protein